MPNNASFGPSQQGGQQFNPGTGPRVQPPQQFPGQQFPGQQFPGQQFPGQQWPQAPMPPKKKGKGRVVLAIVGGVAGLMVISALAGGGNAPQATAPSSLASTMPAAAEVKPTAAATTAPATTAAPTTAAPTTAAPTTAPATTAAPEQKPVGARLGTPVVSGDVEFTLTNFRCGVQPTGLGQKIEPQGKFCVLDVGVKNVGKREAMISDSDITLVDGNGLEFSASSDTFFVEGVLMFETVNPGNKVSGKVYFDVPTDVTPTSAQVKSGWFTKTQTVTLA